MISTVRVTRSEISGKQAKTIDYFSKIKFRHKTFKSQKSSEFFRRIAGFYNGLGVQNLSKT
jgi:hypothetical protein